MQPRTVQWTTPVGVLRRHGWPLRAAAALIMLIGVSGAHAATVYKCIGAQGTVTFRDTPCAAGAVQTKLQPAGQPLIDPNVPRAGPATHRAISPARSRRVSHATRTHSRKSAASWECRAADGEVFYRHTRCPGSVPGDGTVRRQTARGTSSTRTRGRHNGWSKVSVHGVQIPRSEACRRIHSAGAAVRDGHQRDDRVSTYDHLMGRDPCSGT